MEEMKDQRIRILVQSELKAMEETGYKPDPTKEGRSALGSLTDRDAPPRCGVGQRSLPPLRLWRAGCAFGDDKHGMCTGSRKSTPHILHSKEMASRSLFVCVWYRVPVVTVVSRPVKDFKLNEKVHRRERHHSAQGTPL